MRQTKFHVLMCSFLHRFRHWLISIMDGEYMPPLRLGRLIHVGKGGGI
ncbi:MAG: hypothetical protein GX325_10170 [Peptococcaceae bacterium]|nr:hypothetical protein [Peptococcaceae bacterium]